MPENSVRMSFALVGPDGAGKTTTLRMLCGIMVPDAGQASVLGLDTVRDSEGVKARIGYMPQRFGLYQDLTVAENLAFYADLYRVPKAERAARGPELLSFSGLGPFQDRLAGNLSGGMKQKLGLVCALVHTPELLILDEPTCGVDPVSRREFWHILHGLLGTGLTIMLSTAYLDEAERAGRVGLMHQGRLLAVDTPEAVRLGFEGELVEVRSDDQAAARRVLAGHALARRTLVMGDRLMVTVDDAGRAVPELRAALTGAGLTGLALERAQPTLEDRFVQMIDRRSGPGDVPAEAGR
jgi:ABC-2 type transport system ATP-binding protein